MKISVICVGKIKEDFYKKAIAEYQKRLSRYCKLEILEVMDEKIPNGASEAVENQIKEKEGNKILKLIREDMYTIALAIEGNMMDSVELSNHIQKLGISGKSHIAFLIGGSLGLSSQVLSLANEQLSFSKMTFHHQLMRVILLEQVYRSYRIIHKEPYHK